MRKLLAVICTIITIFAIKEVFYIYYSTEADIVKQRDQLFLTAVSITIPLLILSFWLWIPKRKKEEPKL